MTYKITEVEINEIKELYSELISLRELVNYATNDIVLEKLQKKHAVALEKYNNWFTNFEYKYKCPGSEDAYWDVSFKDCTVTLKKKEMLSDNPSKS